MTRTAATLFVFILWIASLAAAVEPTDGEVLMSTGLFFDLGGFDQDRALAIAADSAGRFVVAGQASADFPLMTAVVARLLPDGQLDLDYGANGKVIDPLGWQGAGGSTRFVAVAILANGKALLAGSGIHPSLTGGEWDMIVLRLTADGLVDTTFAPPLGYRVVAFDLGNSGRRSDSAEAMAVQSDGKVVLVGQADEESTSACAVVRLTPDGVLDSTFSGDGRQVFFGGTAYCSAQAVALQSDGRIVVAGNGAMGGALGISASRLETDGDPDPTFSDDGLALFFTDLLPGAEFVTTSGLLIDPTGRLILAAYLQDNSLHYWWLAGALNSAGAIDTTFGTAGWVVGDFACGSQLACSNPAPGSLSTGIARQGDGKLVIAGHASEFGLVEPGRFGIARLLPSGALDPSFVNGGQDLIDIPYGAGSGSDAAYAVALAPDGRILVAGETEWNGSDTDFGVALLANALIFADGFEYGNRLAWTASTP